MAKKKTTTGQTSARMVMDVLKKHYAFTPDTAVGYDAFKNLRLSTSVIDDKSNPLLKRAGFICAFVYLNISYKKPVPQGSLLCVRKTGFFRHQVLSDNVTQSCMRFILLSVSL